MKKQVKKLSLNKKTISNLNDADMNRKVGGSDSWRKNCGSCHGNTCPLHKTCAGYYTC